MNKTDIKRYEKTVRQLIDEMTAEEKISQLTNSAAAISRLNINKYDWWNEALHGVARAGTATVFPQAIGLAAMWNEKLLFEIAEAISVEARAKYNRAQKEKNYNRYYGLTFWSPNINIFRDPRWGRGQETYGEDPYLTAALGVSFIRGLQNSDSTHMRAAACAKHFAVHSGPEDGRHGYNVNISEKDLRETYLSAFEKCVKEAQVEAVMGAYNAVNGVPCCCNSRLLNDILRNEWGFAGHVVSDCGAIWDIFENHKYTPDETSAAAAALKNGCDLNCGSVYERLIDAYEEDKVTQDDIDTALFRTLMTRAKLGMFEKTEYDDIDFSAVACDKHRALALCASRESMVMLKNNGLLPLKKESVKSVAVLGVNGDSKAVLLGNYNGFPVEYNTVYKGLKDYLADSAEVRFAQGVDFFVEKPEELKKAVELAEKSDISVVCLGLDASFEGEEGDANNPYCAGDRKSIEIIDCQLELLREVRKVSKKVILLMFCGGAVAYGEALNLADAVFHCWYPGEMGGKAAAQLIFGEYSPSGRLPVTFYKSTEDLPPFDEYSMKNRTYRYFEGEAEFPFGYGLSYSHFEYSEMKAEPLNGSLRVEITVKNAGDYDAFETVKLFKSEKDAPGQPIKSLTRFEKIFIKKGESADISFLLGAEDFTHINKKGEKIFLSPDKFNLFFE
ncbi:MAG: glycoside hydrolase family 3 C-terminal domain-containing protein [Clostridia bacterium]|nr:glycoside hydrolase family 3 C-terminal domain-containing protein [Clostridia bacterium]